MDGVTLSQLGHHFHLNTTGRGRLCGQDELANEQNYRPVTWGNSMKSGVELKKNGRVASAKLLQERAGGRATSIKPSPFIQRPEVSFCPTGWRAYHRLDGFQTNLYHQPEKMLMFAILVDAISCVRDSLPAEGNYRNRKFLEAKNWLWSDRQDWPFSYRNVCEALGYDPDYLRRGLRGQGRTPRPRYSSGRNEVFRA